MGSYLIRTFGLANFSVVIVSEKDPLSNGLIPLQITPIAVKFSICSGNYIFRHVRLLSISYPYKGKKKKKLISSAAHCTICRQTRTILYWGKQIYSVSSLITPPVNFQIFRWLSLEPHFEFRILQIFTENIGKEKQHKSADQKTRTDACSCVLVINQNNF